MRASAYHLSRRRQSVSRSPRRRAGCRGQSLFGRRRRECLVFRCCFWRRRRSLKLEGFSAATKTITSGGRLGFFPLPDDDRSPEEEKYRNYSLPPGERASNGQLSNLGIASALFETGLKRDDSSSPIESFLFFLLLLCCFDEDDDEEEEVLLFRNAPPRNGNYSCS